MEVKVEQLGQVPLALIKISGRYRVDKGEINSMAESLRDRGQIHPVLVDKGMQLLAGERRVLGAKQLGWETIRAEMRVGGDAVDSLEVELDENQIRKNFAWPEIANLERDIFAMKSRKDNKWSLRKQQEYRDVSKSLVGMRLQLAEALELLPELGNCETQDEAWKMYKRLEEVAVVQMLRRKVPEAVRRAPEWAVNHYIVGDALDGMAAVDADTCDLAEVDPPYGIEIDRRKARNTDGGRTTDYHEIDAKAFPPFMKEVIAQTYRLLKPNAFAVFWYGMQWHGDMLRWLAAAKFAVNPMPALWYKGQSGQTAQPDVALASCYEPFFLARKGQPKMSRQGRSNVFAYAPVSPMRKIHPTEKPLDMLSDIINTILPSDTGANILVPFLGSGVTLRAAYKAGHTGFGFDLSQNNKDRFLDIVAMELEPTTEVVDDEDLEEVDD